MNTVAHNIASKLFVAIVAVAMLFTLATPAKAATAEEMQQMINDLLAQVAALQASVGQDSSAVGVRSVCPFTWTRTLTMGATGADVMKLQQFLNSDTDTRVSASGVGSMGAETQYFGPATAAAVSKMQVKYRADILSPVGLVNPTGTFGPSTMAKANALCVQGVPADDSDDSSDDSSDDDSDDSSDELSGEASIGSIDIEDGDDTEIEEGQEDAPVSDLTFEFVDGDAMITRLDVQFDTDSTTDDLWETLDTVTLWVDGDEVASVDASDEDNYQSDDMTLRISGLDIVAMEDDELTVTVGVTTQNNLDDDAQTITIDLVGMRFVDADDVTTTMDEDDVQSETTDTSSFDIQAEGTDDELLVKSSSEDPDATTFELEDDSKSDWITVFAYTLDTDDSVNDITVNDLQVNVFATEDGTTATTTGLLVNDVQLVVDGEVYDDSTANAAGYTFDTDGDLVIDAGDEVTVEFQVEFKALGAALEGATIQATTTASTGYNAEGADDLAGGQLSGTATGDEHTLRTEGAVVELTDASATLKANTTSSTDDDEGVFTLEFDVTAFNGDLYIDDSASRGTTMGTVGVNYVVTSGGVVSATGTQVATLDSDAELVDSRFKVAEGETESFTLTVEYDAAAAGSFKVQLYSVNFKVDVNGDPVTQQLALPAEDFDTASLSI